MQKRGLKEDMMLLDKYSWPIIAEGMTLQASYPRDEPGSHPAHFAGMSPEVQKAVMTVWGNPGPWRTAEIYWARINNEVRYFVFGSNHAWSDRKGLIYPNTLDPATAKHCFEQAEKAAQMSLWQFAWRVRRNRYPTALVLVFGFWYRRWRLRWALREHKASTAHFAEPTPTG